LLLLTERSSNLTECDTDGLNNNADEVSFRRLSFYV